ncbi:MAG: slipin family protein [Candidatus Acetothermia bacterium]|jgi:regulator of protease activity HflC (stomatin/prohibitin superfamily)|nr:slipin family protein [Candidatus Acetothermia bacterium]
MEKTTKEGTMGITAAIIVALVVLFFASAIKIVREYERGVIFRLGRLVGAKGPGLFLIIPIVDKMVKVDLRTITLDVPPQEVITRDNVPVNVNAVVYFRVMDPQAAVVEVLDFIEATRQISMTTLRSVLGKAELDDILSEREKLNQQLQEIIDEHTDPWGIKVITVEIKDVKIPTDMQRAIARQAEAERERRSKIINAEGELQAAEKLREAAEIMQRSAGALQLRYLQTLSEIATENATTIVFPVPIDLLAALPGRDQG